MLRALRGSEKRQGGCETARQGARLEGNESEETRTGSSGQDLGSRETEIGVAANRKGMVRSAWIHERTVFGRSLAAGRFPGLLSFRRAGQNNIQNLTND